MERLQDKAAQLADRMDELPVGKSIEYLISYREITSGFIFLLQSALEELSSNVTIDEFQITSRGDRLTIMRKEQGPSRVLIAA